MRVAPLIPLLLLWPRFVLAGPATQPIDHAPKIVMLKELVALYEPVPFDHEGHARMADMSDGCQTCHHRSPDPTSQPAERAVAHTQDEARAVPACKSCHPVAAEDVNLHMPSLKGAYHRQCLSCHREWTGANDCVICHAPRNGAAVPAATPDDVVGRMHPPIPEPKETVYRARFTPVAGPNVTFRHEQHVTRFGLRCATCHRRDTCSDCHSAGAATAVESARPRPVRAGKTWRDTHGPCVTCHEQDRCNHCHYQDDQTPPTSFEHAQVGQMLDKDHTELVCKQCHLRPRATPTCGDSSCHKRPDVLFPCDLPGPTRQVATDLLASEPVITAPPSTQPTIVRIRRR